MRRNLLLLLLLALPLAAAAPVRERARPRQGRDPILFVHGWRGDQRQWRTMVARFRADGWTDRELFAWNFDPRDSNLLVAARISARVDQILVATGAERV